MYKKAKCRVKWKGQVGTEIDSEYGVLQGGMPSPKLFNEYLTDLKDYLEKKWFANWWRYTPTYLICRWSNIMLSYCGGVAKIY